MCSGKTPDYSLGKLEKKVYQSNYQNDTLHSRQKCVGKSYENLNRKRYMLKIDGSNRASYGQCYNEMSLLSAVMF